jgi:putative transposase
MGFDSIDGPCSFKPDAKWMCEALDVSKTGYYDSFRREPSPRAQRPQRIHAAVRAVHAESQAIYGSSKIARELTRRDDLESACRNTVARPCERWASQPASRRRLRPRRPRAIRPSRRRPISWIATSPPRSQKWVTDITCLPTVAGWVYLAVVVDLFSCKVVG